MGMGVRAFVFEDHGAIRKISSGAIGEVLMGKPNKSFPEYAGKKVRLAMVYVELAGRRPKRIIRTEFLKVGFNSTGREDDREAMDKMRLAGATLAGSFSSPSESTDILASLQPDLAKLKYKDTYRWNPSPSEVQKLKELVFRLK